VDCLWFSLSLFSNGDISSLATLASLFTSSKDAAKRAFIMNHLQKKRLYLIALFAIGISVGTSLILYALNQNINAFLTPHQLSEAKISPNFTIRLGGMVKKNSLIREQNGLSLRFIVTDFKDEIEVKYVGVLPDLFREGKGVVATGSLNDTHTFIATQILAKHDENYVPKNMAAVDKQS
jgi:cytochrome c-type biogenesis protein CcmE